MFDKCQFLLGKVLQNFINALKIVDKQQNVSIPLR